MHGTPLPGKRVVVQLYGETNRELQAELETEGADVIEIVTYREGYPEDTPPLPWLIGALSQAIETFIDHHGPQALHLKSRQHRYCIGSFRGSDVVIRIIGAIFDATIGAVLLLLVLIAMRRMNRCVCLSPC